MYEQQLSEGVYLEVMRLEELCGGIHYTVDLLGELLPSRLDSDRTVLKSIILE